MLVYNLQLFGGRGNSGDRGTNEGKRINSQENRKMIDKINNLSNNLERDLDGFDYDNDVYRPDLQEAYRLKELRVNPIPMFPWEKDYETFMRAQEVADSPSRYFKNAKSTEVSVDKLTSVQGVVDARALREKVNSQGVDKAISSAGYGGEAIQVVQIGNNFIVVNGNHRASLAKLAGKKTIKVKLIRK